MLPHIASSLALPYLELACPGCPNSQRNKLWSPEERTLCLSRGAATLTATWHPIGNAWIGNELDAYSQIRWVTVHLADRSPWAKQFGMDVSKQLLEPGFFVYEFISRDLQAGLHYKDALRIFAGVGAYYLNAWALTKVPPSTVAIYIYLQPLIAFGLAPILLGEQSNSRTIVAAILIFTGVAVVTKRGRSRAIREISEHPDALAR